MAAELRLGVSFDLVYFRQQLQKLSQIAASEFTGSVKLGIDKRHFQRQFAALTRELRLNINDSQVQAAIARLDTLKARVDALKETKVKLSVEAAIGRRDIAAFKASVQEKLSGITVKVKADLEASAVAGGAKTREQIDAEVKRGLQAISEMGAARMRGGDVSEAARRESLRQAISGTQTITEAKQIAKQLGVTGYSSYKKGDINKLIDKIVAEAAIDKIKDYLDPQMRMGADRGPLMKVLDTFARGFFAAFSMDPAQVRREMQARYRESLPRIDFPATTPQATPFIGPSSSGRLLSPGPSFQQLPGGSPFAQKRLVGDILDAELKEILRNAANTFVDQVRGQLNSAVRSVSVRDLGVTIRGALPAGASAGVQGLLPAAGGTGGYFGGGRRPGGGFVPEGGFPSDGPIAQSSILARPIPSPEIAKFAAGLRGIEKELGTARLPLAGAVAELGDEFGTAAKQVLLYGTAYKALAFFTNLPTQAFNAAKALQTLENQLQAVTGSAANADRGFAFIDDLANRFNVPLQSARDGFVKLYASMEPAGFSAGEIEGLFEGISKATATFGLSADKVDRVNYAFAQMASKGQIMSEELKGQLGDVLPGSLALFARAAQMSIPEFSKAMEDGAFKGAAMAQVLRNVARIMNADFAGAAANSALTLQGALNGMQNSVQRLYEAFEPLVSAIGVQVFPILSEAIGQATLAVTAFSAAVQGNQGPASMLDGNARAIYDAFVAVREIITAVGGVIQGIVPSFVAFGRAALFVAESIAKFVNTPAGGFLADLAVKAGVALLALQTLAKLGVGTLISSLLLAARNATTFTAAIRGMIIALRTSEVAAKAFRTAMLGLVGAGVMFAIEALIQQIGRLANRLSDARKRAVEARDAIRSMSDTELVAERQKRQRNIFLLQKIQRAGGRITSREDAKALEEMGMNVNLQTTRKRGISGIEYRVDPSLIEAYVGREQGLLSEAQYTYKNRDFTPPAPQLEAITPAPPKEKKERGRKLQDFVSDEVANLKNRLEYEKLAIENNIELSKRQKEVRIADLEYAYGLKIVDAQLKAATASASKYKEGQRQAAIQEANVMANQEKLNLQRQFEKAVVGGLVDQSEAYADKLIDLSVGTEDLSEAQKNELFIKKQVQGLNAEQLKTIEPLLKRLRDQAKAVDEVTKAEERRLELKKQREEIDKSLTDLQSRIGVEGAGLRAGFIGKAGDAYEETLLKPGATTADALRAAELTQQLEQVTMVADMLKNSATGIGEAFAQSFSSVLTGAESAKVALGNFFSNIGKMFADMAAKMLAQWMVMKAVGLVASLFPGAPAMGGANYFDPKTGLGVAGPNFGLANGGVINGTFMPITPFAKGGMVTGPTLGLVGEGRFNEAVVPLPDGKSIPVDLGGGAGGDISTNIVVNVNNGQAQSNVSGSGGNQLAKQLDAAVKEVILRETRPGGIIYSSR